MWRKQDVRNEPTYYNILFEVRYQWKYFDRSNELLGGRELPRCHLLLGIHTREQFPKLGIDQSVDQPNASPQMPIHTKSNTKVGWSNQGPTPQSAKSVPKFERMELPTTFRLCNVMHPFQTQSRSYELVVLPKAYFVVLLSPDKVVRVSPQPALPRRLSHEIWDAAPLTPWILIPKLICFISTSTALLAKARLGKFVASDR